ncbi:MAG: class I SAM-dependent methyltransferase, partial [Clostridia bacterium]|nr:class I SAM-dependent methyltransferase [Clostridia bacterium]
MNLYEIKDYCRSNFNVYLKKAIEQIPPIQDVNFLDIGCGTGVSILEIAKITNYNLTAIDTDEDSLKILENKIQRSNYSERISVMRGAIETVNLPEKNYDIILAEGLFNIIGFENGLLISSGFLADNGYMIIHDELKDRAFKLQIFKKN